MDMSSTVIPKSDQLNADDLLSGPKTIKIARVSGTGNADQPVAVHYEEDGGKPYKPCKSMRRVMIAGWGVDAATYTGKSMTLYRDPKVSFGGMEVGGIRISHMSHIKAPMQMALTVTKAKRAPYKVAVLAVDQAPGPAPAVELDKPAIMASAKRQFAQGGMDGLKKYVAALSGEAAAYLRANYQEVIGDTGQTATPSGEPTL